MIKKWTEQNLKGDPAIWLIVGALSVLSIMVVYSATGTLAYKNMGGNTEHYLIRHSLLVILSLVGMWAAHRVDYRYFARISRLALIISVVHVPMHLNRSSNSEKRGAKSLECHCTCKAQHHAAAK